MMNPWKFRIMFKVFLIISGVLFSILLIAFLMRMYDIRKQEKQWMFTEDEEDTNYKKI